MNKTCLTHTHLAIWVFVVIMTDVALEKASIQMSGSCETGSHSNRRMQACIAPNERAGFVLLSFRRMLLPLPLPTRFGFCIYAARNDVGESCFNIAAT